MCCIMKKKCSGRPEREDEKKAEKKQPPDHPPPSQEAARADYVKGTDEKEGRLFWVDAASLSLSRLLWSCLADSSYPMTGRMERREEGGTSSLIAKGERRKRALFQRSNVQLYYYFNSFHTKYCMSKCDPSSSVQFWIL